MSTSKAKKFTENKTIIDLNLPKLYINRELSWLKFNARVLQEALNKEHPLLERIKFLAIFANNLDEFFMIRVSGLQRQKEAGTISVPPDGMSSLEQLNAIRQELLPQVDIQMNCWQTDLKPKLKEAGIRIHNYHELNSKQHLLLREYFKQEIFPTLTPLAFDPGHPFPHISNLSINLAVVINDLTYGKRFARLKMPDMFPRLLRIPNSKYPNERPSVIELTNIASLNLTWIEEVVAANLDILFPNLEIIAAYPFRVTRDADLELEEDEASDLLSTIQESVGLRRFGSAVRLEIDGAMPNEIRDILLTNLGLTQYQVYTVDKTIGLASLMELSRIERPDLKDQPFLPYVPKIFTENDNIFTAINKNNILLYHPYDSFNPVVDFIREATHDPQVLAIKQTLYRIGSNSPIVDALMEASESGKQVAVLVELKARFDEENNIVWAQSMEKAGIHVVYGLVGLKTHAKMCLVVRRERDGIKRYVHLSTGNYNVLTSRIYTDLSFLTCDPSIGADVSDLFNALTGYSRKNEYHKLLVAPTIMRQQIIRRIIREIEQHQKHGNGHLIFKMNALVDKECIQALYNASKAGVKVELQIRSICCLKPGVPGVSENISVTSIVGRFLEHARIYYFHNGGDEEIFLGSADLMPRNLDRRMEILFPIEDRRLQQLITQNILRIHLMDNVQAKQLLTNGNYENIPIKDNDLPLNSQLWFLKNRGCWDYDFSPTSAIKQVAAASENTKKNSK